MTHPQHETMNSPWWAWLAAAAAGALTSIPVALIAVLVFAFVDITVGYLAASLRHDVAAGEVFSGFKRKAILLLGCGTGFGVDHFARVGVLDVAGWQLAPSIGGFLCGLAILHEVTSILTHVRDSEALKSSLLDSAVARLRSIDRAQQETSK